LTDTIELTDIALRIIGAFFAFAGVLATRVSVNVKAGILRYAASASDPI